MVPLENVVRTRETTAPQVINHFNLFRSAEINGVPAPGKSSGEALAAMERLSREALPPGFDFAWAGQSLEEVKAGRAGAVDLRAQPGDRVPGAGRAVRELGAALHHPARRAARGRRRPRRPAAARLRQRRVLPGRARDADRARGQELDPDRRVRGAAARARPGDQGGRGQRRPHPPAAHPDDVVRLHPGRDAARASPPAREPPRATPWAPRSPGACSPRPSSRSSSSRCSTS